MRPLINTSFRSSAFTLVELLAVLASVAVLVMVARTTWCHNQPGSDRAVCASNQRQLMQAWQMYSDDYSGALMANCGPSVGYVTWVKGFIDFSTVNNDNFNKAYLTNRQFALMGYYVKSPSYFRCPADFVSITRSGSPTLRVRSYSMNGYVGRGAPGPSSGFQIMSQMSQVAQPERSLVLLEEHPDSINDWMFYLDLAATGASARFLDLPGAFHSSGANLAMADGHVEYWQWLDSRTMPPITGNYGGVQTPNNPDVLRLQKVASYRP